MMRVALAACLGLAALSFAALVAGAQNPDTDVDPPLSAELVVGGLAAPIFATAIPGDPRLFVLERAGRVLIVEDGELRNTFLDIRSRVGTAGEGGLLGLAFDPEHPRNGLFYAYYTDRAGDSVLSRFELGSDPNLADAASEEVLLLVDQPFSNHKGGTIAFSPVDGHLYLGLGDGGSAFDPGERAQNGAQLLGKMLRLDVSAGAGSGYAIPADNPFVLHPSVRDEIWGIGLRNPFRFGFDPASGDLWIGDVGQSAWEEVDFERAGDGGHNYGWDVKEGPADSPTDRAQPPYINAPPFTPPVYVYPHTQGRCSITGGSVYRGPLAAEDGLYFFGDFCTGQIWSIDPGVAPIVAVDRSAELGPAARVRLALAAIGEDGFGALHVVHLNGNVFRLGPTGMECADGIDNDADGAVDFGGDLGCWDPGDASELDSDVPCDDGYDNDGDGRLDHPEDPGCLDSQDADETHIDVAIEILSHPRGEPARERGLMRVALLGSQAFDPQQVDPASLVFGPGQATPQPGRGPRRDVDRDGFEDWSFRFRRSAAALPEGAAEACLRGATREGVPIHGCALVPLDERRRRPAAIGLRRGLSR